MKHGLLSMSWACVDVWGVLSLAQQNFLLSFLLKKEEHEYQFHGSLSGYGCTIDLRR